MRLFVVFAALGLLASVALAQPGMTPPSTQPYGPQPYGPQPYGPPVATTPPSPSAERPAPAKKSESTAQWAAIGSTALGAAMLYGAVENDSPELGVLSLGVMLVGPSMGHVYAGETGRAVKMTLLRTAGLAVFAYGADKDPTYTCDAYDYDCPADNSERNGIMAVGVAVVLGAAIYDIWDAPRAARRTNAKAAAQWQVAPAMMSSQGKAMPAAVLSGTF